MTPGVTFKVYEFEMFSPKPIKFDPSTQSRFSCSLSMVFLMGFLALYPSAVVSLLLEPSNRLSSELNNFMLLSG